MKFKAFAGLMCAALLTACGGENQHPEELLGTWKTACSHTNVQSSTIAYTFDEQLTITQENLYRDCTTNYTTFLIKLNATYEPELKTTSSGVDALGANITGEDIFFIPHDESALERLQSSCPSVSWSIDQPTSILTCQSPITQFLINTYMQTNKTLFYIDADSLYTSEPNPNEFPADVDFNRPHIKQ